MRAKNEFKFLAEAYNTKLLFERIVDGTLMCPEACCGAPVMECKCGPDCPHCNCFMIQEAVKKNGLEDKRLKIPEEDSEATSASFGDNKGYDGPWKKPRKDEEHDDDSDAALWKKQMKHQPDVSPERWKELQNKKPKPQRYSKKHPKSEDNEEPKRGISGYEHKPDALVSARKAGAIHKPYVSSFVSDGKKIFGVMGSDGEIVHKTRDKREAYKWFRDNYESI
mgnify:CR=1 FL=1